MSANLENSAVVTGLEKVSFHSNPKKGHYIVGLFIGGVVTHLEPDIRECEVKWALGSITTNKASGGDGIPAELHSIHQQILKTQQWQQNWKSCFYSNPKERQCQRVSKPP